MLTRAADAARRLPADAEDLRQTVGSRQMAAELLVRGPAALGPAPTVPVLDASTPARQVLTTLNGTWGRHFGEGRPARAEEVTRALDAAARDRDDDLLRVGAAMTAGYVQRGRFRGAVEAFETAESLLPRVGIPPMVFGPHPAVGAPAWRAMCLLVLGHERAAGVRAEARVRAQHLDDPVADAYLAVIDLYWWVWGDRPERAWQVGHAARAAVERIDLAVLRTLMDLPLA